MLDLVQVTHFSQRVNGASSHQQKMSQMTQFYMLTHFHVLKREFGPFLIFIFFSFLAFRPLITCFELIYNFRHSSSEQGIKGDPKGLWLSNTFEMDEL